MRRPSGSARQSETASGVSRTTRVTRSFCGVMPGRAAGEGEGTVTARRCRASGLRTEKGGGRTPVRSFRTVRTSRTSASSRTTTVVGRRSAGSKPLRVSFSRGAGALSNLHGSLVPLPSAKCQVSLYTVRPRRGASRTTVVRGAVAVVVRGCRTALLGRGDFSFAEPPIRARGVADRKTIHAGADAAGLGGPRVTIALRGRLAERGRSARTGRTCGASTPRAACAAHARGIGARGEARNRREEDRECEDQGSMLHGRSIVVGSLRASCRLAASMLCSVA